MEDLKKKKVSELKDMLRKEKKKVSGNKAELIARLLGSSSSSSSASSSSTHTEVIDLKDRFTGKNGKIKLGSLIINIYNKIGGDATHPHIKKIIKHTDKMEEDEKHEVVDKVQDFIKKSSVPEKTVLVPTQAQKTKDKEAAAKKSKALADFTQLVEDVLKPKQKSEKSTKDEDEMRLLMEKLLSEHEKGPGANPDLIDFLGIKMFGVKGTKGYKKKLKEEYSKLSLLRKNLKIHHVLDEMKEVLRQPKDSMSLEHFMNRMPKASAIRKLLRRHPNSKKIRQTSPKDEDNFRQLMKDVLAGDPKYFTAFMGIKKFGVPGSKRYKRLTAEYDKLSDAQKRKEIRNFKDEMKKLIVQPKNSILLEQFMRMLPKAEKIRMLIGLPSKRKSKK